MTDINPETCTAVTLLFEGADHKAAARDFVIQFADGGLDEQLEGRFETIGRTLDLDTSSFDIDGLRVTLVFK